MDTPLLPSATPPSCPPRSTPPLLANRYEILNRVGEGAMGAVYRALDHNFDNYWRWEVAIKEINTGHLAEEEKQKMTRAVEQEGLILAGLSHRALPRFLDYFAAGDVHYLVMEFIHGETLEHVMKVRNGPVPEEKARDWAVQLCDALEYLHRQPTPVIFRDIKPSNIMVTTSDTIKLVDFGIARIFKEGKRTDTEALGTDGYAPPEQYGSGQTDARSDIFALGATLHHLITGRHPAESPLQFSPVSALNPGISQEFERIVMTSLELNPGLRWQSAKEMGKALRALLPYVSQIEGIITVSPSGRGNFRSIREAIINAKPGSTLEILPGRYDEALAIKKPLTLMGIGRRDRIILDSRDGPTITIKTDGEVLIQNMTLRCSPHVNQAKALHALSIEEGKAAVTACDINSCIQVKGLTALSLKGSRVFGSTSQGIIFKESGTGCIEGSSLYDNELSGIEIGDNAECQVRKCTIERCRDFGILIGGEASASIDECDISGNRLAGIRIGDTANPTIERCKIHENSEQGILVDGDPGGIIRECHIYRNALAGIEVLGASDPLIIRCRIHDGDSNGILIASGKGTIKECQIRRNFSGDVAIKFHGKPRLENNVIDRISEEKWGCFITTATCTSLGKTENCEELELFRAFRDQWLKKQKGGSRLIGEYYSCAPAIVRAIEKMPRKDEIYLALWKRFLSPCRSFIIEGEFHKAQELYCEMVQSLKAGVLAGGMVEEIAEALDNYSIDR